jgi:hypothetical protein
VEGDVGQDGGGLSFWSLMYFRVFEYDVLNEHTLWNNCPRLKGHLGIKAARRQRVSMKEILGPSFVS